MTNLWVAAGPAPEDAHGLDGLASGVSGRVWSIALSPDFNGQGTPAMFLGIAGGGVWRSTDFTTASPTWTPLTDLVPATFPLSRQVGLLNIGALAVDPHHPQTIYAGTGDPAQPGPNVYGNGLLKSTDGGNTWSLLSLGSTAFTPGFTKIFVDPTDTTGNTVYASGGFGVGSPFRGIYKSLNGGLNWVPVQAGMPGGLAISDLDYTVSGNILTLFAGATDPTDSSANGIWQSTDGGNSWSQMSIDPLLDLKTGQSVPKSSIGLINLAADHTPGTPYGAYAAITNGSFLMNVFRLANGTWKPTGQGLSAINTSSAQAIGISPDGTVYVGGVNTPAGNGVYQSVDSGAHWVSVDVGSNGVRPHTDQHAWAFWGSAVYNGNDGGIWRFTPLPQNQAGPGTWESLNTSTLQTILAQGVGPHPTNPAIFLEGSQDNGVALRSTAGTWKYVEGGDASRVRFDPDPKNHGQFAYTTGVSDYSFFFRSDDGGHTWSDKSIPKSPPDFPHVPPYAHFAFHPSDTSRLIVGLDLIYETRNRGDSWTAISGPLAGTDVFGLPIYVSALTYEGGDVIYVAYGNRLFKTTNDGGDSSAANWPEIGSGVFGQQITALAVDPRFTGTLYAATDTGRVWRTKNGGTSWDDISGNLPPIGINSLVLNANNGAGDPFLFVGTAPGVYVSTNQGNPPGWSRWGSGLPQTEVKDLQYNSSTDVLVAATYGRGIFTTFAHLIPTVHIHIPKDTCRIGPVEGSTTKLRADITGFDLSQVKYDWSSSTGDHGINATFPIILPTPPAPVTVTVTVQDLENGPFSSTVTFTPLSFWEHAQFELICKLMEVIRKEFPHSIWIPRGDPPSPTEITEREVYELHQFAVQVVQMTENILELYGLSGPPIA